MVLTDLSSTKVLEELLNLNRFDSLDSKEHFDILNLKQWLYSKTKGPNYEVFTKFILFA